MNDRLYAEILKDEKMMRLLFVCVCVEMWLGSILEDVVWQHQMNLDDIIMSKDPTPP